jgi:hypothetical protein
MEPPRPDLHAHQEARFDPRVFETPAIGVRLDVAFRDPEGRSIHLRAEDLDPRGRRPSGFLAPVSGDLRRVHLARFAGRTTAVFANRRAAGTWAIDVADQRPLIAGRYTLTPDANRTRIALTVDRGWRPRDLKPSLRVLTRLMPVFRRWPTTYRWEGTLGHHGACLDGGWSRR